MNMWILLSIILLVSLVVIIIYNTNNVGSW
jgi:hypothetical protein